MRTTARFCYRIALIGFIGLFALLMLWNTVLSTHTLPTSITLMLTVTPLLLPMRGFLNGQIKQCAWLTYISLFYFIHGSTEAYSTTSYRLYPLLETLLSLMIFFGSALFIRCSKAETAQNG